MTCHFEHSAGRPVGPEPQPGLEKRRAIVAAFAVGLAVLAIAGTVWYVNVRGPGDEKQIKQLTADFAVAVALENPTKIASLLCRDEAAEFTDNYEPADSNDGAHTPETHLLAATASDIRVVGDVASARISRSATYSTMLYFRRESGGWKVCAAAADQLNHHR